MTLEFLQFIRDNNTLIRTLVPNHTRRRKDMKYDTDEINKKYRIRLAVVIITIQWPFKYFHFRYRHLKVLTEGAFLTCRGREFQMTAPEYMNDLRKSLQLCFGVYSWLQLVDLVSRLDTSEVYETYVPATNQY